MQLTGLAGGSTCCTWRLVSLRQKIEIVDAVGTASAAKQTCRTQSSGALHWSPALVLCRGLLASALAFQALYKLLYNPRCIFRSLSGQQFGLLQGAVNHKLVVDFGLAEADICKGGHCIHLVTVQLLQRKMCLFKAFA